MGDKVQINLKRVEYAHEAGFTLAEDRDKWRALVPMVI
jgi:hypothetical protein